MSKEEKVPPLKFALSCDTCHGNQVIRGLLWCESELEAAIFIKQSCHQFASVKNVHSITALHVAAAKGWNKMCRWLLRNGADTEARVKMHSYTPIEFAAMFGNIDTLLLLSKAGGSSKETPVSSNGLFKHLYSNMNFELRFAGYQLADAYTYQFATFLRLADFQQSIECVDLPVTVRRKASRRTATNLSVRQLKDNFLRKLVDSPEARFLDCEDDDIEEEIREMVEIDTAQKKKIDTWNQGSSVYVFGLNQNYNLGLGTDDRRDRPTQLERLTREQSVVQACLSKYHSLYLSVSGTVRACGHGVGGRLGVGREDTCVRPEPVKLPPGTKVVMVAAGADHSLFLTAAGEVYACGLNSHYQLGLGTKASDKFVTPKKIPLSPSKATCLDPPVVGVACSDWHSVLWTKSSLYTWGTNLGQLGQTNPVIYAPRAVTCCSALVNSSGIYMVSTNNVCTVAATHDGMVAVLHYGRYSVITKRLSADENVLLSLSCFGGDLSRVKIYLPSSGNGPSSTTHDIENLCNVAAEPSEVISGLVEKEHPWDNASSNGFEDFHFDADDLVVIMVTAGKNIYLWSDKYRFLRDLSPFPSGNEEHALSNIIATPSDVLAISDVGEVLKLKLLVNHKKKLFYYRSFSLTRLHRARKISCDARGQNFAVLTHGSFPKYEIKHKGWKTLMCDMEALYKNASVDESLCDVVLVCEGKRFPAHEMVLAAKSLYFRELFSSSNADKEKKFSSNTDEETSPKKDCKDEPAQKDPSKRLCKCSFSNCSKAFEELSGFTCSDSVEQKMNEQNRVEDQKASEIHVQFPSSFNDSSDDFADSEAPTLPTVDVSFVSVVVLPEILHFCYTGMCEQIRYPDFKFNSANFRAKILKSSKSESAKAPYFPGIYPRGLDDPISSLHSHLGVDDFLSEVTLEKFITSLVRGVQALKIQDFTENCELHPDPSLHRSLSIGVDVQFEAPDGSLGPKAHRFILSARVPFFNALFSTRWAKKSYSAEGLQLVRSLHCRSPAFFLLLQFCYTGFFCSCNLTLPLLQDVIALADELLVSEARTLAEKHAVEFIDRRNLMSLYQFSLNFNCPLLRQHVLFFAYFDTPFMLENRLMENLRAEDLHHIAKMHKKLGRKRMSSLCCSFVSDVPSRSCSPEYYLNYDSDESDSERKSFTVSALRREHTENQRVASALREAFSIGPCKIEEDPMFYLRSKNPELFATLMEHSKDMKVELECEDFEPPEEELELPKCPFKYHTHSLYRSLSSAYSSDLDGSIDTQWPESLSDMRRSSWSRGSLSSDLSFDDLVDRRRNSSDEDANPWYVVGRRYDEPLAKSLPKRSDSIRSCNDCLDDAQSSSKSRTLNAVSGEGKRKNSNHGNGSTTNASTRRKTKRSQLSSSSNVSDTNASSSDQQSTTDKQIADGSETSELGAKVLLEPNEQSPGPSIDRFLGEGNTVQTGAAASNLEDAIANWDEFPSIAESVKAAAQQQLLTSKSAATKATPPFVRTSQKQRKKQMREQQETEAAAASGVTTAAAEPVTAKAPTPAWGLAPSVPASAEQQEFEFPSLSSGRVRRTSQRTLSSSSGGSDFGVGSPQSASNFSAIMQREKTMKENYEKSQRKSLEHIQMEERAIAELEQYYGALAGAGDTISVKRYSAPQSLPLWTEKHRPRDML